MRNWLLNLQAAVCKPPGVVQLENTALEPYWAANFHATRSHELLHVLHGRATIEYRERSFPVGPQDTFVIPRGTPHRDVRVEGTGYKVLYVFFRWPGADRVVRAMAPEGLCAVPAGTKSQLHMKIMELEGEYLGESPGALQRMNVILLEMLLALSRYSHPPDVPLSDAKRLVAQARRRKLAADVRGYLTENYGTQFSLEDLASRYRVSPFHLCRTFTREFGTSMTDMLTLIRIERAKEMLEPGELSVKEVARLSGFTDPNYFAKVFRKVSGLSPSEFRLSRAR